MKKHLSFLWLFLLATIISSSGQTLKPKSIDTDGIVYSMAQSGDTVFLGGSFSMLGFNIGPAALLSTTSDVPDRTFPIVEGFVYVSIPDGSGGWYLGGSFSYEVAGETRSSLAHVLPNHTFDPGFDAQPDRDVQKLILSGSTLYTSGSFTQIGGENRNYLAALSASTGKATTWAPQPDNYVADIELYESTLFVSGSFAQIGGKTQIEGQNRIIIAALSTSTGKATEWTLQLDGGISAMALDGNILYLGGGFTQMEGQNRQNLAAVDLLSGALTPFAPKVDNYVNDLSISGATLYAAGDFSRINGILRPFLAAMNTTTGQVSSWNPHPNGPVYQVALSGTTLYAVGNFDRIGSHRRPYVAAISLSTGQIVNWTPEPNFFVYSVTVWGNAVLVGGSFTFLKTTYRDNLAAYSASTGKVLSWKPGAYGTYIYIPFKPPITGRVNVVRVQGSTVYVGGDFHYLGGQPRLNIGALSRTSGLATPWDPGANGKVFALEVDGATIYAGGTFTRIGGKSRHYVAALENTSGTASPWNPILDNTVHALAVNNSTIFVGGSFTKVGQQDRGSLAAFKKTGGFLLSWNPLANGRVYALALDSSLVYAGGSFTQVGGQNRSYVAALEMKKGLATVWNPNLNDTVFALMQGQGYLFAGGSFSRAGEQPVSNFAMLDTSMGAAVGNYPQFNKPVHALHYHSASSTLHTGGQFTFIGDAARSYLASFNVSPNQSASDQVITFHPKGDRTLLEDPVTLEATASSGLPVLFSVVSGPATILGNLLTFTSAGTVVVQASQPGNKNFNPAPVVVRSIVVRKAKATIQLDKMTTLYNGSVQAPTFTTSPANLPVTLTFDGSTTLPVNAGGYEVVATVNTATYQGSASGFFVIRKVRQQLRVPTIPDLTVGGTPYKIPPTAANGLPVLVEVISGQVKIENGFLIPIGPGGGCIAFSQPGDANYLPSGKIQRCFTIHPAEGITHEVWASIPSSLVDIHQLPSTPPTSTSTITSFMAPSNLGDNYFARVRAYLLVPISGEYRFHLTADDRAEVRLSPDEDPSKMARIAYLRRATKAGRYHDFASQQSELIYLEAGRRYYIEAVMREFRFKDHLSVAWTKPNGTMEVIPGANLIPFTSTPSLEVMAAAARQIPPVPEVFLDNFTASPNPFSDKVTISFSLANDEEVRLEMYTFQGQLVKTLHVGKAEAGKVNRYEFESGLHANGVYICRITVAGKSILKRLLLHR
ncbi:MBG domain-containing protein [Rufibacter hautae]|nr:MBG domain-containing protein [Rufibacter hautae]